MKRVTADEVAAYSGERDAALAAEAAAEVFKAADFACRRAVFSLIRADGGIEAGPVTLTGKAIATRLEGCERCHIFCATLGHGVDRLIERAMTADRRRGYLFDCAANIQIEHYCDEICLRIAAEEKGVPVAERFSCGYADLPLALQPEILNAVGADRIGVCLTDGLMMKPFKTVTAIVGVGAGSKADRCSECLKREACDKRICND